MFKTLIEKLRIWSHPDCVAKHTKCRLAKLQHNFYWKKTRDAKEGRKCTEISHYPKDDLDLTVEKVFCDGLEAGGFKTEVKVSPGGLCHDITVSWGD